LDFAARGFVAAAVFGFAAFAFATTGFDALGFVTFRFAVRAADDPRLAVFLVARDFALPAAAAFGAAVVDEVAVLRLAAAGFGAVFAAPDLAVLAGAAFFFAPPAWPLTGA